eukprot:jgi/Astpho2/8663/fgenesh1_pg.00127_%23_1_t
MRAQLESLKADIKDLRGEATANKFSEEDLQLLWDKRCRDQEDLKASAAMRLAARKMTKPAPARSHAQLAGGTSFLNKKRFMIWACYQELAARLETYFGESENSGMVLIGNPGGRHASTAWYLVDGICPEDAEGARTLLVTSPDRQVYKEAIKRDNFKIIYMPVWSLEELEKCRTAMYPEMAVADVRSRFDHWGGIPRFVLAKLDHADQRLLVQAISSATLPIIIQSVGQAFAHPEPYTGVQITRSLNHLLNGSGIRAWLACLKKEAARISFCVPAGLYSRYKKQSAVNLALEYHCKQYVVKIDVDALKVPEHCE